MRSPAHIHPIIVGLVTAAILVVGTTGHATSVWSPDFAGGPAGIPGANSRINKFLGHGTDTYAMGPFTQIGGVAAEHIARWDGNSWHALGPGVPTISSLSNMAIHNDELYVAHSGGIERWDGANWHSVLAAPGGIYALVSHDGHLYVGGAFEEIGGVVADRVARWNGTKWFAVGTGLLWNSWVSVRTMASYGGNLFIGDGSGSDILRWNGVWNTVASFGARQMIADESYLYVNTGDRVYSWAGNGWTALGQPFNSVAGIAVENGKLYAGTRWAVAPTGYYSRNSPSDWDLSIWNGSAWTRANDGVGDHIYSVSANNGIVLVGGTFDNAAGMDADFVAEYKDGGWATRSVNGTVFAVETIGNDTYVGGDFRAADGSVVKNIVRWDGTSWHPLQQGVDGIVRAILRVGSDLYVGGEFTDASGVEVNGVARWDGSNWSALGDGFILPGTVHALAHDGTNLYAVGDFLLSGGTAVYNAARWDGSQWHAMGIGLDNIGRAAVVHDGELYVGGDFTKANGLFAFHLAKWNGTTWSTLGVGLDAPVHTLVTHDGLLYAGGEFLDDFSTPLNRIARWNNGWEAIDDGVQVGVDGPVFTMQSTADALYIGGGFENVGGIPGSRLASWNGTAWAEIAGGTNNNVRALRVSSNSVCVGGDFTQTNGTDSYKFGVVQTTVTGIDDGIVPEAAVRLEQNWPNPFVSSTQIAFFNQREQHVTLRVYNVAGELVRTLRDQRMPAGSHSASWQGLTDSGATASSGVYFYRIDAGGVNATRKMVLLR